MAKKFMYVCLGILALAGAYHLGAQYGRASIVDHTMTGVIAHNDLGVLLDNGEVWYSPSAGTWTLRTDLALPVPLAEVKFWQLGHLITNANELWVFTGSEWQYRGSPPGVSATQTSTWGEIKAEFGDCP